MKLLVGAHPDILKENIRLMRGHGVPHVDAIRRAHAHQKLQLPNVKPAPLKAVKGTSATDTDEKD